jgi:hypothetical protein
MRSRTLSTPSTKTSVEHKDRGIVTDMDDASESSDRDERGQFKVGHSGLGGRPIGAKSKLTIQFLLDLRDAWEKHGKTALENCATQDPLGFVRVVANLLPRDINVDLNVDMFANADSVLTAFRMATDLLGADSEKAVRSLKRHAPHLIEHDADG